MRFANLAIWAIGVGAVASVSLLAQTATTTHKKSTHKQLAKSTATAKPAATPAKPAATTTNAAHASTTRKSSKKPATTVARRSTQQQPTTDRYREIQMALSQKGYLAGEADGNWTVESVTALKRFQRDQNLTDDGKLGSLSLIALGLGPHRNPAIAPPSIEAAPAPEKSAEKAAPGPAQQH